MAGVGVFDTLFISADANFSIIGGDLYLKKARVSGKGSLRLHGEMPQRIISEESQVANLHLSNPGTVTLKGSLGIDQSLTIEAAVFEIYQAGLIISDSSHVQLLSGARMYFKPELAADPFTGNSVVFSAFASDAMLPSRHGLQLYWHQIGRISYRWVFPCGLFSNLKMDPRPPEAA